MVKRGRRPSHGADEWRRRSTRKRATPRAQMCARRLLPGCGQGCYRDQSQNPLTGKEPSRAYARPAALRASLTAAARRSNHLSVPRARRNRSRCRRAERQCEPSFASSSAATNWQGLRWRPERATAFSGAAAATSLPAGAASAACRDRGGSAGGGEAAAVASLRPNGSRAIGGLSTAFRIRTIRALGAMADAGTTAGADVSLDSGRARRRTLEAARLCRRDSRGWPRAHPRSGRCRVHSPGTRRHAQPQRSPSLRCPNGEGRRHPKHKARPRCPRTAGTLAAMRNSRRKRGVGEKSPNSGCRPECSMRPPCEKSATRTFKPPNGSVALRKTTFPGAGFAVGPKKSVPASSRELRRNSTLPPMAGTSRVR